MSHRYDMVVIDLDGTLLGARGTVSNRNRAAIESARAAGIRVMIATGRALVESFGPLRAIDQRDPVITAGGSLLNDVLTGRTLSRHVMPEDLVADVTDALLGHGHKVLVLKDSHVTGYDYLAVGTGQLDPSSEWWFETLPVTVRFVETLADDPHPGESVRVGAVASEQELTPIAMSLRQHIGDRGFLQHWSAVTETTETGRSTHLLEVFNPNVSKWTMVESFCREHDIEPNRVAAIGDGLNDVELIREAGLGIAMRNADPRVQAVADVHTDAADDDGVATAVERILSGQW